MNSIMINGVKIGVDFDNPIDLSIPLKFNGAQPNAFGVENARSSPCEAGDLVGDTRRGGSVNFENYSFIPHCNGTHTECVGHITNERISVRDCLQDIFVPAILVSLEPESEYEDLVIGRTMLEDRLGALGYTRFNDPNPTALIVRTVPNDESKLERQYDSENIPPYFSIDAMEYIVECGFDHLLVDLPSIDRIFDDGKLLNHRMFWHVASGSFEINPQTRGKSTISELIYVPNEVTDGEYLLNLQIAPFESDASPSRPILFKIE